MNVTEFKLWFKGLTAGLADGQVLTAAQVKALREMVESLGSDEPVKAADPSPDKGGPAAPPPIPSVEEIMEEFRKQQERKRESYPKDSNPWGPYWRDPPRPDRVPPPYDGGYPYPDIWCGSITADPLSYLRNSASKLNS